MRDTGSTGRERTRKPADERRRELAEAAAAHFHRLGFHGVSLADVAAGVGVTAPAVYRHYRNKNALLDGAITTGLDHVDAALSDAATLPEALDRLAEAALRRRDVWVLLQREMRHLADDERAPALARFRAQAAAFARHVATARPDLDDGRVQVLATAAVAVLASPSTRPVPLAHERYRDALVRAATAVCAADLDTTAPPVPEHPPEVDPGRGAQLLDTAIGLFHRHGYAAVSVDDIGAAAGMAGPSIYHHFPTKSGMLVAAYRRAHAQLPDTGDIDALLRDYTALAAGERELFGVYATEDINLPADARRENDAAVRADVARWSAALRGQRPDLDETHAALLVHAARGIVHDVVRVGRLHTRPAIVGETVAAARAVLHTDLAGR